MDSSQSFLPSDGTYLLSHSVGRPLRNSRENLHEHFFMPWEHGAADPWWAWLKVFRRFQQALSALLGGPPEHFCPQTNVSSGLSKVLFSAPRHSSRNKILLSKHDFPSIGFVASQAAQVGLELEFLPANANHTDPQVWIDALTPDVQWVLITHAQSNTGVQVPVAEIVAESNRREILSVVDIAQSAGILPIDVEAWNATFVVGSCVKWLCGGPGAGFLWVNPAIVTECRPLDVGWWSHENPFEFNIHDFRYHPGALRFWGGTPSVMPCIVAAHSIEYLAQVGVDKLSAHNMALVQRLIDALPPNCIVSPGNAKHRSGTLIIDFDSRREAMMERLRAHKVHCDARARGIRISPHIYNSHAEIEMVAALLQQP